MLLRLGRMFRTCMSSGMNAISGKRNEYFLFLILLKNKQKQFYGSLYILFICMN